ncbi:nose resistant to fluoxetine protein 6-like [Wyeomyia smithii]|uniref:nose resistant to fluoxetine protein 6-like n=1 Tax=Wyeomyia smithii TaxID=174621 RepID=UPI002467F820|nr:nose resistant to fluoxetine protein 6-like [Wyeomyia smithii]
MRLLFGIIALVSLTGRGFHCSDVVDKLERIPYEFATFLGAFQSSNHSADLSYWKDQNCVYDLSKFGVGLQKDQQWALKVYDLWGKMPSGLSRGNYFTPGDFEQCRQLAIGPFGGHHCTVRFGFDSMKLPLDPLWLGICVPNTCKPELIKTLTDYFAQEYELDTVDGYNQSDFCYREKPAQELDGVAISAIVVLSCIGAAIVMCTLIEVLGMLLKIPIPQYLKDVSLYTGLATLFKTEPKAEKKTDTLDCVHGLRSFLMIQIIVHHVHHALRTIPVTDNVIRQDYFDSAGGVITYRVSALSADIFLVISAMLMTYGIMKELTLNSGKFNVWLLWLHRIVRILPAYAMLIYFWVAFGEHLGEGPLYRHVVQPTVDACTENWWTAILFVQNYVNPEQMCIPHTWYLSIDMQLYIVTPLLVYALWKLGVQFAPALALLMMASMVCVFATFSSNDFWLNPEMTPDREAHRLRSTYYATHARMSVWFFGIAFGYFLFRTREKQVKWSPVVLTSVSIFATALAGVIMFCATEVYKPPVVSELGDAFYESLHRVAWVGCHMWLIFMCVNGYGSVLDSFLSWTMWQPIARLSYCMYLIHYLVVVVTLGGYIQQPLFFTGVNVQFMSLGVFGITAVAALIWTLFIERPVLAIEKNIRLWVGKSQQ